ncbi:MAG: hypothetical protein ACLRQZ_09005 [Clostridia bacterium]
MLQKIVRIKEYSSLDNIVPSESTILDGTYTLQRPFVMATKVKSIKSEQVQAVFNLLCAKGQEVIKSVGLVVPNK